MASTSSLSGASTTWGEPSETHSLLAEALESTSTLINPSPPLSLIFDRNSVINATIHARSGPVYKVVTNRNVTRTELCDLAEQRVVATIKRRDIFPDVIVFSHRQKKSTRVKKWLKKQKLDPGRSPCTDLLTETRRYVWRSDETHRLALYEEQDGSIPIAYSRSLLDPPTIGLVLHPTPDSVRIEIIMSFLLLEHKLRMKEKAVLGSMLYGPLNGQFIMMG